MVIFLLPPTTIAFWENLWKIKICLWFDKEVVYDLAIKNEIVLMSLYSSMDW
jgi:hypothetical protein